MSSPKNQYEIMEFFTERESYITTKYIANTLGKSKHHIREIMLILTKKGFISRKLFKKPKTKRILEYRYKRMPLGKHLGLMNSLYVQKRKMVAIK